jgi:type VI secretion system secreted protein VgrG
MEIDTPVGPDLLFRRMRAREEMSRLFEYQIELLSEKKNVDINSVLGQNVTVKLIGSDDEPRYFNGIVAKISQGGRLGRYFRYFAEVRPWLWLLTRTSDCRIFQDMKVDDIIKKVFGAQGMSDFDFQLTGSYRKWIYCVQYRETDFNFVSRLLEHEGIGYYFKHTDGHHKLILTDSLTGHEPCSGAETLPFSSPEKPIKPELPQISSWEFTHEVQPGSFEHDDYDFERPKMDLKTKKVISGRGYSPSNLPVYDYPGYYVQVGDGAAYADTRIHEFGAQFDVAHGVSNSRNLLVGGLFTLEDYDRDDQNREYLIIAGSFDLEFGDYEGLPKDVRTSFHCSIAAIASAEQFRPKRLTPKPFVQGPQTAVVTGPAGEEIHVDKYGRIKVQFHWDRQGKQDEHTSCWIRVSHPWAGQQWGAIAHPRMGQEVIIDFLEGDPDQPICTGRVYNADEMPPYTLPGNKTQTGIKSRSSLGGGPANYNELRFEDKKGSEMVTLHAEKDQEIEVEHDERHWVGHDRTKTIDHDETTLVKHDRTETVDHDETITIHGKRTETVDKDETITIHMNRTETVDKDERIKILGNRSINVSKSEDATVLMQRSHTVGINESITIGAAQEITVGGAQAISVGAVQSVTVGGNQSTSVGANHSVSAGGNQSTTVGKNASMTVSGDETRKVEGGRKTNVGKDDALEVTKKLTIVAGDAIMIKTGDAVIEMKKDGTITIKGKDVTVEGSGKINVKASSDLVLKGSKIAGN